MIRKDGLRLTHWAVQAVVEYKSPVLWELKGRPSAKDVPQKSFELA